MGTEYPINVKKISNNLYIDNKPVTCLWVRIYQYSIAVPFHHSAAAGISTWPVRIPIVMNHASKEPVVHSEFHETHYKAAKWNILKILYQRKFYVIKNSWKSLGYKCFNFMQKLLVKYERP